MKKISILCIALFLSLNALAQENKGLDNRFYFRLGYSNPNNSFMGYGESPYQDFLSKTGGVFELGSIFMLNNLDLGDGLRLGINVDYAEVTFHYFEYDDDFEQVLFGTIQVSSKVGPSLSFSPVNRLVFDGFIKLKVPWFAIGYFSADDPDIDEEVYTGAIAFGYSAGINIRYGILMIGFDYNNSSIKMNNTEDSNDYLGNFFDLGDDSDKSKFSYYSITIGLNF